MTRITMRTIALLSVSALSASGALLAVAAPAAQASPTVDQIVTSINVVGSLAGNLNEGLGGLSAATPADGVQTYSQTIITNISTIISDLSVDDIDLQTTAPLDDADAQTVAPAYSAMGRATSQLLANINTKHDIFAQYGLTAPIAAVLRSFEASLDSDAIQLINVAPTQQTSISNTKGSLDKSVGDAIALYGQLCIPSPLYPTVQPVCIAG
jgi:hypothetical protein